MLPWNHLEGGRGERGCGSWNTAGHGEGRGTDSRTHQEREYGEGNRTHKEKEQDMGKGIGQVRRKKTTGHGEITG